ncbi:MAG: tRNA 2-thiocytidine biosynthesis TtcA family protein [Lachnospiraceae bacterium]|nr:tRNA 2-thiocytidine biosynthesis TtcA family protein [Lachnospiraceae bacterium]
MELDRCREIERSIIKRYRKSIWRPFIKGIQEYELIQEGDKIAVCISGGKDSMLLAKLLQELQRHGKMHFELKFLSMNPGYSPKNKEKLLSNAELLHIPLHMFDTEIFDIVKNVEENPCYLCARMRRGHLYKNAQDLGCNKIALGHHFDDVIETILMGMMYGGQIQTMMPKLHSTNFSGMELIRPMYLIKEADIITWKNYNQLEFLQCACRFTENISKSGDGVGESKRQEMKEWIKKMRETSEVIDWNIFRSVHDVNLDTLIGYHNTKVQYHFLDDYEERRK